MNVGRRKPSEYMQDMLDVCRRMERYIAGKNENDFFVDIMLQDAILRNIEVLGEAAKQLLDVCPDAHSRFPALPFGEMYVTRNRLIHGYASLRLITIWEVASRDVPPIQAELEFILSAWPADLA